MPLDPLTVVSFPDAGCLIPGAVQKSVLESLPDNAVRVAIGKFDASGQLSFGPLQVGTKGENYQVILDYINVDTTPIFVQIGYVSSEGDPRADSAKLFRSIWDEDAPTNARIVVRRLPDRENELLDLTAGFEPAKSSPRHDVMSDVFVVPVYVGVGLRLTATVSVIEGSVNLSSLGALAAEAQAGRVSGSLVVQTLGISGEQVAASLPLPSALDSTTVQNAIMALGSIKAIMYKDGAQITPRVIGLYNPIGIGGQALINALISEIAGLPIQWIRSCKPPATSPSPSADVQPSPTPE